MSEVMTRSTPLDVEIDRKARTISGIFVPWGERADIFEWPTGRYTEEFARGAFPDVIANPRATKLLTQHDSAAFPIGQVVTARDDAKGLWGQVKVAQTTRGDEALELADSGVIDAFSVGFRSVDPAPDATIRQGSHVVRKRATLPEVSLVTWPAYNGARVDNVVRSESGLITMRGLPTDWLDRAGKTLSAATLDQLQRVLDLIAHADDSVDEALVELSSIMGVANPDKDADGDEPSDSSGRRRSLGVAEQIARRVGLYGHNL